MALAGSLTYDTKIDKKGFEKGLSGLKTNVGKVGKDIAIALGVITAGIAGVTTKILKSSIEARGELEQNIGGVETLFKDSADTVIKNANNAYKTAGMSANKYMENVTSFSASLLQSTAGDTQKAAKIADMAMVDMSDNANKMGTSMESITYAYQGFAKQNYMMLDNLKLGYGGTKTEMERLLKDAQKITGIKYDIKNLSDVYEAIHVIQGELGITGTTAKEATETLQGSISSLKASWENFLSGSGNLEQLVDSAKIASKNLIRIAKEALIYMEKEIINFLNKNGQKELAKAIKNIKTTVGQLISFIIKNIPKVITTISSIINLIKNNKVAVASLTGTVLGLVGAYKAYQAVQKVIASINMAKSIISLINPMNLLIAGIVAGTVAISAFAIASDNEARSLNGLHKEVEEQRSSWDELKKVRQDSLENSNIEINATQKLADELRQITDENGQVKEGYENRAKYILGELNKALGTEYTMNGNIIEQYEELKNNIDKLILSKKAEATLNAFKPEYEKALHDRATATDTLVKLQKEYNDELKKHPEAFWEKQEHEKKLRNFNYEIARQKDLIGQYGYTIQNYEELTSASVSENQEEISKAIEKMGVSYDRAKEKVNTSLSEQIQSQSTYVSYLKQSWQEALENNDKYQSSILETQMKTEQESLTNLARTLAEQTDTVGNLTDEQKQAWKNLADSSYDAYEEGLKNVPPETKKKIEEATGVVVSDVSLENAAGDEGYLASTVFGKNLSLGKIASEKVQEAGGELRDDSSVENGAKEVAEDANRGFNNNVNGSTWGSDLISNLVRGMTSSGAYGLVTGAAGTVAGWISAFLKHSVPKKGPLKDELTYMPDMINNLVYGIEKNKYKVTNAVQGLTSDMEERLKNVVNLEVGSMNATATVRSNNMYNSVIQLNAKFDGSVDINGQKAGRILAPDVAKTIKTGGA